jgi:hypothetical protein
MSLYFVAPANKTELRQETFIATLFYRRYVCFLGGQIKLPEDQGVFFLNVCSFVSASWFTSFDRIVLAEQLSGEHMRCTSNFTMYFIVRSGMRSYPDTMSNPQTIFFRATSFRVDIEQYPGGHRRCTSEVTVYFLWR